MAINRPTPHRCLICLLPLLSAGAASDRLRSLARHHSSGAGAAGKKPEVFCSREIIDPNDETNGVIFRTISSSAEISSVASRDATKIATGVVKLLAGPCSTYCSDDDATFDMNRVREMCGPTAYDCEIDDYGGGSCWMAMDAEEEYEEDEAVKGTLEEEEEEDNDGGGSVDSGSGSIHSDSGSNNGTLEEEEDNNGGVSGDSGSGSIHSDGGSNSGTLEEEEDNDAMEGTWEKEEDNDAVEGTWEKQEDNDGGGSIDRDNGSIDPIGGDIGSGSGSVNGSDSGSVSGSIDGDVGSGSVSVNGSDGVSVSSEDGEDDSMAAGKVEWNEEAQEYEVEVESGYDKGDAVVYDQETGWVVPASEEDKEDDEDEIIITVTEEETTAVTEQAAGETITMVEKVSGTNNEDAEEEAEEEQEEPPNCISCHYFDRERWVAAGKPPRPESFYDKQTNNPDKPDECMGTGHWFGVIRGMTCEEVFASEKRYEICGQYPPGGKCEPSAQWSTAANRGKIYGSCVYLCDKDGQSDGEAEDADQR